MQPTNASAPHVRVMSNDKDAMLRIADIAALPTRERTAALREWMAEQHQQQHLEHSPHEPDSLFV